MIPCRICGTPTQSFKHPKMDILFHECPFCELIFKDESNHISKEKELEKYDMHQNGDDNLGYVNFLTNFIDSAVTPHIKDGYVLDFGSGPNPLLSKILKNKYNFTVDIYDLYYATHKIYKEKKYDLITSTEVIEHLADPLASFKLFNDILKPGGFISIMTLFYPKDRDQFFSWFYIRDMTHLSFFTPRTMEVIADLIGFKLIETNQYRYAVLRKPKG